MKTPPEIQENQEVEVTRGRDDLNYIVYFNPSNKDTVYANFKWNSDQVYELTLTLRPTNFMKIMKVTFCAVRNQIEIRGHEGQTPNPFRVRFNNLYINREKVLIIDYGAEGNYVCEHCHETDDQPDVKDGNIIIGA